MWLEVGSRSFDLPFPCVIFPFVSLDATKGHSQWDFQGSERQLPTECWEAVPGLQAGYVLTHAANTSRLSDELVIGSTESTKVSVVLDRTWADQPEGGSDSRKWQSAGTDLIHYVRIDVWKQKCSWPVLGAFQYGVPVIKYDRRGFKPRPRQLLLTNTFAVLVDKTKIKQRFDYAALRGQWRFVFLYIYMYIYIDIYIYLQPSQSFV